MSFRKTDSSVCQYIRQNKEKVKKIVEKKKYSTFFI